MLPVAGNLLCSDEQQHIHRGSVRAWDLCMPLGSSIYPLADGVVIFASPVSGPNCDNAGGYGCWVMIDYGNGFKSIFGHMIRGSITVRTGDRVKQNQPIGKVGWTGMTSFGPHVHFELHHAGDATGRAMIGDYFDRTRLKSCALCNVPSGSAPVNASGSFGGGSSYSEGRPTPGIWWFFAGIAVTIFVLGFFWSPTGMIGYSLWHGGSVAVVILILLVRPTTATAWETGPSGSWETAYGFTAGSEGWKCTEDGAHTKGGVTQGTYTAWRMSQGMGPADVCLSLTELQRQQIFQQRFWAGSGADKLQAKLAISYVDHVFNTGRAKEGIALCGTNIECFNDWRVRDYQGMGNCYLYCEAWINRVNRVRRITEVR